MQKLALAALLFNSNIRIWLSIEASVLPSSLALAIKKQPKFIAFSSPSIDESLDIYVQLSISAAEIVD